VAKEAGFGGRAATYSEILLYDGTFQTRSSIYFKAPVYVNDLSDYSFDNLASSVCVYGMYVKYDIIKYIILVLDIYNSSISVGFYTRML